MKKWWHLLFTKNFFMHNPSDIFLGKNIVFPSWGLFLESLGNFSGPKSNIQIKI